MWAPCPGFAMELLSAKGAGMKYGQGCSGSGPLSLLDQLGGHKSETTWSKGRSRCSRRAGAETVRNWTEGSRGEERRV